MNPITSGIVAKEFLKLAVALSFLFPDAISLQRLFMV